MCFSSSPSLSCQSCTEGFAGHIEQVQSISDGRRCAANGAPQFGGLYCCCHDIPCTRTLLLCQCNCLQVSPDAIMEQMQTMTKSYGIKAVGRAAAATVMLPLAVGVDLIILPGPQVWMKLCEK